MPRTIFHLRSSSGASLDYALVSAFANVKRIQPLVQENVLFWLDKNGIASVTRSRPAMYHPLFSLLAGLFAAFDFARKPFSKTSRMFFVLGR